jgi:hypothetical protein
VEVRQIHLLSVLLARLKTGGMLAGMPLRAGRAVVISEEAQELWWDRGLTLALDGHVHWFCRPFRGRPTPDQWLSLLEQIVRMHDYQPVDLLAIDSPANLAPMRTENDAAEMLKAVAPLQSLTARGISVLLAHHPKKGAIVPGQAARGSGALSGYADILVEMQSVSRRNALDRRRRLRAYSRYAATTPSWVISWTPDGTDYLGLGPSAELDFAQGRAILQAVFENAVKSLSRQDILAQWPDPDTAPAKHTLWKWLDQLVNEGRVLRDGRGTKREPYEYSLPGMIEKWHANLLADLTRRLAEETPIG